MENRLLGALLLLAAPVFSQIDPQLKPGAGEPLWFHLDEGRQQVGQLLGKPVLVTETGADFFSWQYQIDSSNEEYSHYAVFRKADGKLISVTRQFEPERMVDEFFPAAETNVFLFPGNPAFGARVRRLSGGRLLIAMGSTKPGQPTGQLLLIREAEINRFHPWIASQLTKLP